MRPAICLSFVMALVLGNAGRADDKQFAKDKRAFERARKASTAKSWDAAITILERINIDDIDDVEVIEYVDFSLRCAKTAEALGIDRNSNPSSPTDVIAKIDWAKVIATLAQRTLDKGPAEVASLLSEARKIQSQIPRYLELDNLLMKRYNRPAR